MKERTRDAEVRLECVQASAGRRRQADHSLFTESFTSIFGQNCIGKKVRGSAWHGLMSETRLVIRRVQDSKERANNGARCLGSRLQRLKGHKGCQIGLEVG
jgi:hypothetical protein